MAGELWVNTKRYFSFVGRYKLEFGVLLLITLIVESTYVIDKYYLKVIIDGAGSATYRDLLVAVALGFAMLVLVRISGKWLFIHLINRLDGNLIADIKRHFFEHILRLDYNFHTTHKTGSLISKLSRGGRAVESMMDSVVFNFAPLVFQLVVGSVAVATVGILPALVILLTTVAFLAYSIILFRFQMPTYLAANETEDVEKGNMSDFLTNIDSIKYYGKEQAIEERYRALSGRTRTAYLRTWDLYRWVDAGHALILGVSVVLLVGYPISQYMQGLSSLGDLAFIYTVYLSLVGPMFGFVFGLRNYYRAMSDFESLYYYKRFENAIKDRGDAKPLRIAQGRIEFRKVWFKYHDEDLFKDFTLTVEPDEKVAIVGRSGSGKSTLIKLLYRLYDIHRGKILVDGVDIRDVTQESLRSELSIVPQEAVLFDDTIYNNIAFSDPSASRDEVLSAMRFAQLDRLVARLPKREDTIVGERGVKLSGGEKQRVSIARALLAGKKVLVLDEATSALDSQTEKDIQRDLSKLMRGRTAIIIAHRLSTIMGADKIVVLDGGRISQVGRHEELIVQEGPYRHLWELQKGGYIE